MKALILSIFFMMAAIFAGAQKIDSIYIHLYTDSLKRGTYNYINIDGKLENGRYLPLDSSHIKFSASDGTFYGNSLFIPADFTKKKVTIKAVLRSNPAIVKEFDIYIKQKADPDLKSEEEIWRDLRMNKPKVKTKKPKKKGA
ncbi:MAG: hypothetical protein J5I50_10255 [Chitinophagaceae bacterium]|nr:hypothetical protein [Chitinophagaceae bacterium]